MSCKKDTCENGEQDEDETGIDCGGSCSACNSVAQPTIVYPSYGEYNRNILSLDEHHYSDSPIVDSTGLTNYDFMAILKNDASVLIRWTTLTGISGPALIPLPYDAWVENNEDYDMNQTFRSNSQDTLGGEFWVYSPGSALIEYYENAADTSMNAPYYKLVYY